jgi:hypothetical protein
MLPKSYAQTSLDGDTMPVRPRTGRADQPPTGWPGGAPTGRGDQGGPREIAARNGEALMRRRSVTVHREAVSALRAGADIAGRMNRRRSKRPTAVVGGWTNDGHVDDEFRTVVTWR